MKLLILTIIAATLIAGTLANASCNYIQLIIELIEVQFDYTCKVNLDNPSGLDNYASIRGTHVKSRGDNQVDLVSVSYGNSAAVG